MSDFKDKVTKSVEEIYDSISNEEERAKVLRCLQELITDFTTHLVQISEFQNELEEQIVDLQEAVVDIQNEMRDDNDDLLGNCPYCGEEVFIIPDEKTHEFECPHCHKIIIAEEDNNGKQ